MTLTFDPWPRNEIGFVRSSRFTICKINIINLNATVHELSCTQAFLPYLAIVKNPKIRSCDLDLWPMTMKFSGVRTVVETHVPANFHQTACSGSWVIALTEKKNPDENNTVRRYRGEWLQTSATTSTSLPRGVGFPFSRATLCSVAIARSGIPRVMSNLGLSGNHWQRPPQWQTSWRREITTAYKLEQNMSAKCRHINAAVHLELRNPILQPQALTFVLKHWHNAYSCPGSGLSMPFCFRVRRKIRRTDGRTGKTRNAAD